MEASAGPVLRLGAAEASTAPALSMTSAAGRPIRWGVLGWGAIARRALVPTIMASPDSELVAVASVSARASDLATSLPSVTAHTGRGCYGELLSGEDIDAVYVALPNHLHAELTCLAAAHGKHVLCEKPLATSAQEARHMAAACEAAGVVLMEAFMAHFNPQHERVRQLIDSGVIGHPNLIQASLSAALARPANDIRFLSVPGAGALYDVGIYCINAARWIFGSEPLAVRWLAVELPGKAADATSAAVLRFDERRLAVIDCGLTSARRNCYAVVGEHGVISVARPFSSPPFVKAERELLITIASRDGHRVERFVDVNQYGLMLESFQRVISGEDVHPYPPEESIKTARVLDACRI